jgi:DNA modification methylase
MTETAVDSQMTIVQIPLGDIQPDPDNPRLEDEELVRKLATNIERDGLTRPLVLDQNLMVVSGHKQLQALQHLGWPAAPCIVRAFATDHDRKRVNLAQNNLSGENDPDKLKVFVEDFDLEELELVGFEASEIEELLEPLPEESDQDDEVPEVPAEPVSRRGDLWLLGEHRLLCGDATSAEDVKRLMQGEKAALFATDPPYGVAYHVETGSKTKAPMQNDENDGPRLQAFLEQTFRAWCPYLREDAAWYLWHAQLTQGFFAAAAAAADILIHRQIIWVKPSLILGHGDYHWQHELCFYGWKQGHRASFYGERNQTTIWEAGRESETGHPTQKPVELWLKPLQNNTRRGDIAADPFLGSGTTLIACQKLNRRCYGMEIEPRYVDVSVERWCEFTGEDAVRESDGQKWSDLKAGELQTV